MSMSFNVVLSMDAATSQLLRELFTPEPPQIAAKLDGILKAMSQLTDAVDAAIAVLKTDSTNFGSILATLTAAKDAIAAQLVTAQAGEVADEAELQKALDALNAAHAALNANPPPPVVPPVNPPPGP